MASKGITNEEAETLGVVKVKQPALPFFDLEAQRLRREKKLALIIEKGEKPLNNVEKGEKPSHTTVFNLKVATRRRREIELRSLGYKILQIQERLAEEGQFWSEDTIKDDLKSITAEEWREELNRQQSADISLEDDRKVKLEFRDRQIERLTPRKSPEVQINVANQVQVEKNVTVNQLLLRYQQFRRERDGKPAVCSDNSGEQLDKAKADS